VQKEHINIEGAKKIVATVLGRLGPWTEPDMQQLADTYCDAHPEEKQREVTVAALNIFWNKHPLNESSLGLTKWPRDYSYTCMQLEEEWTVNENDCPFATKDIDLRRTLACQMAVCAFMENLQKEAIAGLKDRRSLFAINAVRNADFVISELNKVASQITLLQCDLMVQNVYTKYTAFLIDFPTLPEIRHAIVRIWIEDLIAFYNDKVDPGVKWSKK